MTKQTTTKGPAMESQESLKFIKAQYKKMLTDKWDEGVKTRRDPGESFVIYWIEQNADDFRKKWKSCKCRTCSKVFDCGFKEATDCTYQIIEYDSPVPQ